MTLREKKNRAGLPIEAMNSRRRGRISIFVGRRGLRFGVYSKGLETTLPNTGLYHETWQSPTQMNITGPKLVRRLELAY
jgi:hypothetical protein